MSPSSSHFTDLRRGNWIDRRLPKAARPYARLARLDRPIGTWLLAIPCWWGVALAATGGFPDPLLLLLFGIGAVVMRGAGCVINDLYDRELDAQVARTQTRPLASGEVQPWQAVVFLKILLLIGLGVLLALNRFTVFAGIASLVLVFTYPLMKRVTWWPQLFLGFTFNWGALLGWAAVKGSLGLPPLLLYAAGIFWTLGYDTIYAHQDTYDDARIGVKSTARLFGEKSRAWVALFYALSILLLALAGWSAHLGYSFYAILVAAAGFAGADLVRWRIDDPENCLERFKRNRNFGIIVFVALVVGQLL